MKIINNTTVLEDKKAIILQPFDKEYGYIFPITKGIDLKYHEKHISEECKNECNKLLYLGCYAIDVILSNTVNELTVII